MTRLPSGQRVAISSERARLHATRKGIEIHRHTPAERLRSLVDILHLSEAEGHCRPIRRHFTGYTLADRHWLECWRKDDRHAFERWLSTGVLDAELEAARRRVIYDDLPRRVARFACPRRLYSVLARRVGELPLRRATVSQWRGTLANLCRRGVSRDELRWSGVPELLDGLEPDQRIHRDDLRRRIGFPGLRLELTNELVADGDYRLPFREVAVPEASTQALAIRRFEEGTFGYHVSLLRKNGLQPSWQAFTPRGCRLGAPQATAEAAMVLASRHAASRHGLEAPLRPSDRYGWLTLAGGSDYREWLLTLPEFPASYFTPHFTERNLLLHIRTNRRQDHRGRDLLFIEEIQSDWHQRSSARRRGNPWDRPVPRAPFAREWLALGLKLLLIHAVEEGIHSIAWAPASVQRRRFHCGGGFLERIYDREMARVLAELGGPWAARPGRTEIPTREPWLCMRREGGHWRVASRDGRFRTRPRFTREEALDLTRRHGRKMELEVPLFHIPDAMRHAIRQQGLPLFGTRHHFRRSGWSESEIGKPGALTPGFPSAGE